MLVDKASMRGPNLNLEAPVVLPTQVRSTAGASKHPQLETGPRFAPDNSQPYSSDCLVKSFSKQLLKLVNIRVLLFKPWNRVTISAKQLH